MAQRAILIDHESPDAAYFRAISGQRQSTGRTPGEALDTLLALEGESVEASTILIQRFAPDAYFTQAQYDRMQALLARRTALSAEETTNWTR